MRTMWLSLMYEDNVVEFGIMETMWLCLMSGDVVVMY